MSADCSVYVIGFDANKAPSKVGMARDPVGRMASLQTAHFQKLTLAGSWTCPNREIARALEVSFHQTQAESRLAGMVILMIGLGVMLNKCCGMEPAEVDAILAKSLNDHSGRFAGLLVRDAHG
jgi:hypothetical protein